MENKKEKVFVDGLRVSKPNDKSPEWVKLNFGANVDQLVAFLQKYKKQDGWVNFDLKKSKGDKLYLELNTFERKKKVNDGYVDGNGKTEEHEIKSNDLPF